MLLLFFKSIPILPFLLILIFISKTTAQARLYFFNETVCDNAFQDSLLELSTCLGLVGVYAVGIQKEDFPPCPTNAPYRSIYTYSDPLCKQEASISGKTDNGRSCVYLDSSSSIGSIFISCDADENRKGQLPTNTVGVTTNSTAQRTSTALPTSTPGADTNSDAGKKSGRLSMSDQIAIGVGVGIGLPMLVLACLTYMRTIRQK